jgi:hypothetical protein
MPPGVWRQVRDGRVPPRSPGPDDGPGCASRRYRSDARTRRRDEEEGRRGRPGHRGARGSRSGRTGPGALRAAAHRTSTDPRCARSGRQLAPSLAATRLDHGATGAIRHAVTETVTAGTTTGVGLVGALHGGLPPRRCPGGGPRAGALSSMVGTGEQGNDRVGRSRRCRHVLAGEQSSGCGRERSGTGTRRLERVEATARQSNYGPGAAQRRTPHRRGGSHGFAERPIAPAETTPM